MHNATVALCMLALFLGQLKKLIWPVIHCSCMHTISIKTWESVHVYRQYSWNSWNIVHMCEQCIPGCIFKRPGNNAVRMYGPLWSIAMHIFTLGLLPTGFLTT